MQDINIFESIDRLIEGGNPMPKLTIMTSLLLAFALTGCAEAYRKDETAAVEVKAERTLQVTASAYNSLPGQTDSTPNIAAWGDRLEPGMKAIAVSRDLLTMGLKHNTEVTIKGLPGKYRVLDKMNKRWKNKIDIYMGNDRRKALKWGRRPVEISWVE